ncbi:MAG: carboxypeptidase-like regulatory domain-containing protein, partial [Balneolaceae bacterium]|nr:carboxypeptidase-like regulatory domain-containing protein [Balneolaceae bacterium]
MEQLRKVTVMFVAMVTITQWGLSSEIRAQDNKSNPAMLTSTDLTKQLQDKKVVSLADLLSNLEQQFDVTFLYKDKLLKNKYIKPGNLELGKKTGQELSLILHNLGLSFTRVDEQTYVILEKKPSGNQPAMLETVSGQVTDAASGEPLPGVNVVVQGTTTGTSTDSEGSYELNVPSLQDTLVFSFIGYQTQEVAINGRTSIDVALQTQAVSGEEILVTGYSSQRQAD